jgi:hypothetical protein
VALAFLGPPPTAKHHVAHNDNDPANSVATNLRWATPKENNDDKAKFGTTSAGEGNGMARLTPEQVRKIRTLRLQGKSLKYIGDKFGVTFQAISKIVRGDRWRHL